MQSGDEISFSEGRRAQAISSYVIQKAKAGQMTLTWRTCDNNDDFYVPYHKHKQRIKISIIIPYHIQPKM